MIQSRTHNCSQLRLSDEGTTVTIVGWYDNMRKVSRNLGFLILRDFYGVTQVVIETEEKDLDETQNNLNRMNDKYEQSVRNGVELMRSLGMSDQEIVSRLCDQYHLTEIQAASFLEK